MRRIIDRAAVISVIISLIIVILSPFIIKIKINNNEQLDNVRMGFPVHFIEQETLLTPNIDDFPIYYSGRSPWKNPTKIRYINMIISFLITYAFVRIIYRIILRR